MLVPRSVNHVDLDAPWCISFGSFHVIKSSRFLNSCSEYLFVSFSSSASTTDLSSYDGGFLRTSPDQYSSRGSMESIDHLHPSYSSCTQLSVSKSSNSIEHLHSKRDSAYSSFSTSSSIPEYITAAPSFSKERSYSMDSVSQHRTNYDSQQGVSREQEVPSAAQFKSGSVPVRMGHYSSNSNGNSTGPITAHRHSVGPVWGQANNHNSYENLKGAPSPPVRSDSFAVIRNHDRPNSWSSLEQARSFRALQKASWNNSSNSATSGKSSFTIEGQLHTVIEKSPESSPTIKPKQTLPAPSQPGSTLLPAGIYSVSLPEAHFTQIPTTNPSGTVYPTLANEAQKVPQREHSMGFDSGVRQTTENGYQSSGSYSNPAQNHELQTSSEQAKSLLYRSNFQSIGQERKDPYTPVHPRREKPKYPNVMDHMETSRQHKEKESSRYKEQNIFPQQIGQYQGSINSSGRSKMDQDLDHPLTRLENALAEVQRSSDPVRERTMSVMEKVSHFERHQSKPSNHSFSGYSSSLSSRGNNHTSAQARSWSASYDENAHVPPDTNLNYQPQLRKANDLQRSKSFFQLSEEDSGDTPRSKSTIHLLEENCKDVQLTEDFRDIAGIRDSTFNQSYRNSIKDAQSKVLRSTSFRRRDLSIIPPPVPEKHTSLERKGPKTGPKPSSPHTPKERHVVPVKISDRPVSPEFPRVPPVVRICGRKRFSQEQKKRSYSEPENMHEVGVSDREAGFFTYKSSQPFPETSVADRRKMFELAASRNSGPKLSTSRPELKQMQQDALADYVERKTGRRMEGRQHRPRSAYIQSASSPKDSSSLTSTLSLCSLAEPGREDVSGLHLPSPVQRSWHPSGGSERYPDLPHRQQGQTAEPQKPTPQKRHTAEHVPDPVRDRSSTSRSSSGTVDGEFIRAGSGRNSGRSVSTEDLLDHTEERLVSKHFRSKSSPVMDNTNQVRETECE